ncbi:TonB-dependent receptor [Steroidobacter sp. S1-65]|uniref:TonB-dependent receptor n=1 Tax=Steroidobacter gossypii TaxID=2805490 RepID=A0ABS1WY81_9GAMM|nr:TonB-dependent receptor [Steroidobacter gossypii]MBM0105936.1 TonB-dependent receptor [Steroidobacter gossypii]
MAQELSTEQTELNEVREVVVYATRYRDRTADIAPVLSYDLEYFQKFEPNTVGDMLKRVPGVAFVGSDIAEYDGAQLRGLGGGYTQVLINGKRVPGAGDDRSFWVDRIPAEMVERVEILRSNSANRSGDAVAGAINIILRDSYSFDGTYVRAGLNHWYDGEANPTFGAVTSGDFAGGRILAGVNIQDRYRAKEKRSDRFSDASQEELVSWEDQTEVKDGRDYSANLSYIVDVGDAARLTLDGFFVKTDRDVTEVSFEEELDDGQTIDARVPGLNPIDQKNWGFGGEFEFDMMGGATEISVDHARFQDDSSTTEETHSYISEVSNWDRVWSIDGADWDGSEAEAESVDASDAETGFKLAHKRPLGSDVRMEFGVDYRQKKRDITYTTLEWEAEEEGDPVMYEPDSIITSVIKEKRLDPYMQFSGDAGKLSWELGLRYETTDSDIRYVEDGAVEGAASTDYDKLLPSVHFKWDVSESDRISLSLARSVKRPNFNELIPALLDGEYGDNDYIGNPRLEMETANGVDLGYERRLGRQGVVGVNLFYRRIENLIELTNTGIAGQDALASIGEDELDDEDFAGDFMDDYMDEHPGASKREAQAAADAALRAAVADAGGEFEPDSWLFTSENVGTGKVYGVELDVSTPLSVLGLPNTGVFLNYSWVKSEVTDFLGERRFNDQAKSVYNIGFIHDLPVLDVSFGATYRKQGDAFSRVLAEEVTIRYGDELDLFVEKRFGNNFSVRLSANNLLDASKDEIFHKFDNMDDQIDRDYDEFELESEEAGPYYQIVARWAF